MRQTRISEEALGDCATVDNEPFKREKNSKKICGCDKKNAGGLCTKKKTQRERFF